MVHSAADAVVRDSTVFGQVDRDPVRVAAAQKRKRRRMRGAIAVTATPSRCGHRGSEQDLCRSLVACRAGAPFIRIDT
jgi:hypothetical protein